MSKKHFILYGFMALIALSVQTFGQKLSLPFRDVGACPFECCTYREWKANKPTVLLKNMSGNSPAVFKVKKGETVQAVDGMVITTKAGIGRALSDTTLDFDDWKKNTTRKVSIKKGERVLILTPIGEGFYKVWYKGLILQAQMDSSQFKTIIEPKYVWWVKVKNRKGQSGWTNLDENFDNKDSCS
jgi:hypothetical protein